MKVLITSDTHLEEPRPEISKLPLGEVDAVVHAGDLVSLEVFNYFTRYSDIYAVRGNADKPELKKKLEPRTTVEFENVKVGITHGHRVNSGQELEYVAMDMGVDLLVYGHSHSSSYVERSVGLLNPGSPTRPRGGEVTYAVLNVDGEGYEGGIISVGTGKEVRRIN